MMWGWGAGGWIAGLWMILFPLAAALLIAWIRRTGTPSQPPQEPRPTAMEILDVRYARGEIDALELAERRRELARHGPGS